MDNMSERTSDGGSLKYTYVGNSDYSPNSKRRICETTDHADRQMGRGTVRDTTHDHTP